ncbi:Petrobactin import ATP-binding protein FpuC [subsurface metagenome]
MAVTIAEHRDVVVSHRDRIILGPLSLTVKEGDFLGIIGPNGAGKSTLLKTLTGCQHISQGSVRLFENHLNTSSQKHTSFLTKKIGILLQHHDYYQDIPLTVKDIILFGRISASSFGKPYSQDDFEKVGHVLDIMGLTSMQDRLFRELSGGEQQKVHLARLIAQNPALLLLDEPTTGLDIDWQERMTGLIGELYTRFNKTVIMVTHGIDHLPISCNKVLLLKRGVIFAIGAPHEVFTKQNLSGLYECGVEVIERDGRYHVYSTGLEE